MSAVVASSSRSLPRAVISAAAEQQHSIARSVFLHLAPGALTAVVYALVVPGVLAAGYPPLLALLIAVVVVVVPLELGELLRQGRAASCRISLRGAVPYRRPMPVWQYAAIALGFVVFAFLASGATGLLESALLPTLWAWFPAHLILTGQPSAYAGFARGAVLTTFALVVPLNWVVAPVVEELYFRGYLLPRLSRLGFWAPVLNGLLFALYHFWQPYAYLSIAAAMVPLAWLVWRKQNVYLGIVLHVLINVLGNLYLFAAVLGS